MKALLDACVLYPTVMREMLLGAAGAGLYRPLWSARILEEWARAMARDGPAAEAQARGEIALVRAAWPGAEVAPAPALENKLWLPDAVDIHVLASAVAGAAELIVTSNAGDFPRGSLRDEGLDRIDPDTFLLKFWIDSPDTFAGVARDVRGEAERLSGKTWPIRKLMKKARLPRLGKALDAAGV